MMRRRRKKKKESDDDFESNIPVQVSPCYVILTGMSLKHFLNNGDVGYISLRGEFYGCDVCSKHNCREGSKDAHTDYCKQSKNFN